MDSLPYLIWYLDIEKLGLLHSIAITQSTPGSHWWWLRCLPSGHRVSWSLFKSQPCLPYSPLSFLGPFFLSNLSLLVASENKWFLSGPDLYWVGKKFCSFNTLLFTKFPLWKFKKNVSFIFTYHWTNFFGQPNSFVPSFKVVLKHRKFLQFSSSPYI